MTVSSNTLRLLLAAGLAGDALVAVVESMEGDLQPHKDEAAERRRAYDRERKRLARSTGKSADSPQDIPPDSDGKNKSPHTPKEKTTPPVSPSLRSGDTPLANLAVVLDAERAAAVVEHRRNLGKPLTRHAARLLAGKFAKTGDPNGAADAMVAAGWQGFEPEWLANRTSNRGPPQPSGNGYHELIRQQVAGHEPDRPRSPAETHRAAGSRPGPSTLDLVADPVHAERR